MNFLEEFHKDLTENAKESESANNIDIDAIAEKVVEKLLSAEQQNSDSEENDDSEEESEV